ncbi:MAG: PAS domain-containing protein [Rhizobiaceae bacterium]|nr:PAS domain-containing protein [Rhizobiaceae bacterium]MCV0409034.1 PAS domain-containing protein [Rhizobiaceae bacterium]
MVDPGSQRQEPNQRENDRAEAEICRRLVSVLPHTGVSIAHQDPSLRYIWARNIPPSWSRGPVAGQSDEDLLPASVATRLTTEKRKALELGRSRDLELQIEDGRRTRWFQVHIEPEFDQNRVVIGLTSAIVDATDQKRREQTLSALLREVSHRSKNLLAIILSIAGQTGRYSTDIATFLERFRGRIHSLSFSQDLVTSSNWRGAALGELIRQQTARYAANPDRDVVFTGVDPRLNPGGALHIGLALHELAVNSLSYGALSRPDGRVEISATPVGDGGLELVWREVVSGDEPLQLGERRFGSIALERVVPTAIGGHACLEMLPDGLRYALTIPADQFDLDQ